LIDWNDLFLSNACGWNSTKIYIIIGVSFIVLIRSVPKLSFNAFQSGNFGDQ
jgi:hypothetical protein